ncbi:MAG: hypothetical protein V4722_18930 [Bacteroidota bacterium]
MSENDNFKGMVTKVKVMEGSKSERTTHVLKTTKGDFPLRLKSSNPFYDNYFEKFEGKEVDVEGVKKVSYLQVKNIEETKTGK